MITSQEITNLLKATDAVLCNPSISIKDTLPKLRSHETAIVSFLGICCLGLMGRGASVSEKKLEEKEKERLKILVIQKQQAVINRLNEENSKNRREINNLKETVKVLEDALKRLMTA